jgi:hypothetical protein
MIVVHGTKLCEGVMNTILLNSGGGNMVCNIRKIYIACHNYIHRHVLVDDMTHKGDMSGRRSRPDWAVS